MKRFLFFLLFIIFIFILSCDDSTGPVEGEFNIKYSVTGISKKVDVIYESESGKTTQIKNVSLPWSLNLAVEKGSWVYVSAQNVNYSDSINVAIYKNGELFSSASGSGSFIVVTAGGIIK